MELTPFKWAEAIESNWISDTPQSGQLINIVCGPHTPTVIFFGAMSANTTRSNIETQPADRGEDVSREIKKLFVTIAQLI